MTELAASTPLAVPSTAALRTTSAFPPLREDLVGRRPYGAPQLDVRVRLNTNENPYPPSDRLAEDVATAVSEATRTLNRYPDREALELRKDLVGYLAAREGHLTDADHVWVANGSNEIMHQLCQAFGGPGRTALGFAPTYSMYPEYCRDTFTRWRTANREDDFTLDPATAVEAVSDLQPALVIVASPNNPTGTALPMETLEAICDEAPGLVVVDEAYAEFRRPGSASALSLLESRPNLVVTRTLSKAFALAGARVGYLIGAPEVVNGLRLVRLPYHLSSVTQAVARTALAHSDDLLGQLQAIRDERDALVEWLLSTGLPVAESDANFVLFGGFSERHIVWQELVDRGVLVREVGPDGWLRVTIGTPTEMADFRSALNDVRSSGVGTWEGTS